MNCIRCGKPLDAEALESGACQYCGQAIQDIQPAGNIRPSLPKLNAPAAPPVWASPNDEGNDRTELSPLPFAAGSVPPPGADPFGPGTAGSGTAPFMPVNTPPAAAPFQPGPPPSSAMLSPVSAIPPFTGIAAAPAYLPAAPARPQRRRRLILAAVTAFVAVALIAGGLLFARSFAASSSGAGAPTSRPSTPAASPTATVPATRVYVDPNGHFTISYPTAWTAQPITQKLGVLPVTLNGAQFQGGNASLKVLTGKELPLIPNQAAQADMALLQVMGGHAITSAEPKHIGGQTWTTKRTTASNGDKLVATSITYQGKLYSIVYSAPSAEFSQDETQTFTPMLNSFTFGA